MRRNQLHQHFSRHSLKLCIKSPATTALENNSQEGYNNMILGGKLVLTVGFEVK